MVQIATKCLHDRCEGIVRLAKCLVIVAIVLVAPACATSSDQFDENYDQYNSNEFGNKNDSDYGNEFEEGANQAYGNGGNQSDEYDYSNNAYNSNRNAPSNGADYAGYNSDENSDYGSSGGENINNFNDENAFGNLLADEKSDNANLIIEDSNIGPTITNEALSASEYVANNSGDSQVFDTSNLGQQNSLNDVNEYIESNQLQPSESSELLSTGSVVEAPVASVPDILPLTSELWWVGYDFNRRNRLLKIQILTKGIPSFDFLQEQNQNGQPELVVRFYGTSLRRKIKRDIDASEFSSPVAYVRMREDAASNTVDVVLTVREDIRPLMFAKNGNVQLTFPLTAKYLGAKSPSTVPSYEAESLSTAQILPEVVEGSEMPKTNKLAKAYIPDPVGKVFDEAPNTGSKNVVPLPTEKVETLIDQNGLPLKNFGDRQSAQQEDMGLEELEDGVVPQTEGVVLPSTPLDINDDPAELLNELELNENTSEPVIPDQAFRVVNFSWLGVAQDDFSLGSDLSGSTSSSTIRVSANDVSPEGDLNFNDIQTTEAASDGGLNLSDDAFDQSISGTVPAETLTMDDLGSSSPASDIIGSDSEIVEEGFTGKPVVLEFYEAPLGQVLKAFADQIGTNFIYPPSLAATKVSIKLKNVPWDAALNALLETNGLGMARIADNIVRIDLLSNMTRYISDRQEAKNIKMMSQPSKILVIRLSNMEAQAIQRQIQEFIPASVRRNVNFSSDAQTNTLYIEAPPAILSRVKSLVERLDVPVPQVEIESRLIEVARSAQNFLGVSWAGAFNYDANRGLGFGTLNVPNSFGSSYSVDPGVNNASAVGSSTFNIGSINNIVDLSLRLKMEEAKGTAEILQSSRLMVKDRVPASISAGTIAYLRTLPNAQEAQVINQQTGTGGTGAGGGGGGVTQIPINLSLNVTPRVTNDGHVEMQIQLRSAAPSTSGLPGATMTVNNRELQTLLRKKSGETAVIGGIYDTKKIEQVSGIPFFSSLPIVGALFRSKTTSQSQTEMMMLITPRIQTDVEDAVAAGESVPATYQGGGNLSLDGNDSGGNFNNSSNYGNNYDNANLSNGMRAANNSYNNEYGNEAGENDYEYNSSGNSLMNNVNQSNAEYSNNYGNY